MKWQRVLENKEKLTLDKQSFLKSKMDKESKLEKSKKNKFEERVEDMKGLIEHKH